MHLKIIAISEVIKLNREDEIFDKYTNAISKKKKKCSYLLKMETNMPKIKKV